MIRFMPSERRLRDWAAVLLLLSGLAVAAPAWCAPRRLALVIGNSRYAEKPLKNPGNDARRMSEALSAAGFSVTPLYDADLKSLTRAVNTFVAGLQPEDVALVYYSGHGLQIDGENFLLPVDFAAQDEADVPFSAYSAQRIQARIEGRGVAITILILDACRDNPYRSLKSMSQGLAAMTAGRGTFIAFASGPGATAADNPEAPNSVFTGYLLEALAQPGLYLDEVFNQVRQKVNAASRGRQVPWASTNVIGSFYFLPPANTPANSGGNQGTFAAAFEEKLREASLKGRGRLGIDLSPFTPEYGSEHGLPMLENGVVVSRVMAGAPADQAGVKQGDVIRRVDGKPVTRENFPELIRGKVGSPIRLEVWRGSDRLELIATPTDSVSFFQRSCEQGNGYGCDSAALLYWNGDGVEKDLPLAVFYFEKGCKLGELQSCNALALALESASGTYRNIPRAITLYRQACDGSLMLSCYNLGLVYLRAKDGHWEPAEAERLFRRACDGGDLDGCNQLALLYQDTPGVPKDFQKALKLLQSACDKGSMDACNNLGVTYWKGTGVEKDAGQALAFYQRACQGRGMTACGNLGRIYRTGQGAAQNFKKAAELFEQACNGGEMSGCYDLALALQSGEGIAKNPTRATEMLRKACDGEVQAACDKLNPKPAGKP